MYEKEVKRFTFHIYTLLECKVKLSEAIKQASYITENKEFKEIIEKIQKEVEKGGTFETALSEFPFCFPTYYIGSVALSTMYPGKVDLKKTLKGLLEYDLI